ncbi:MAG: alpha/beta hydrolase [Fibrobacteria bacterium]|nr:alpha/beta hydrolase [Fibrobacteria bacterium]
MLTVFFPGLGADSTLAKYHPLEGRETLWIQWPNPVPADWSGFLDAVERQIPKRRHLRFVGISFGGPVALSLSRRCPPDGGVFLVGSLVQHSEIRWPFRVLLAVSPYLPEFLFDLALLPDGVVRAVFGIEKPSFLEDFRGMAARLPARSVQALCRLLSRWDGGETPIAGRMHGTRDRILCVADPLATRVDGGHLISMTHGDVVEAWLVEGREGA